MKHLFPSKLCKLLVLIISLILVATFTSCSNDAEPEDDFSSVIVSQDNLEVHKKAKPKSRVVGELPADLEIEILEVKTAKKILWGRIDKITLPDGTKVKGGWIDLDKVIPADEIIPETEPIIEIPEETEPEPVFVPVNMGTVVTGKLNIRKDTGSQYDVVGSYLEGTRIEILETKTVDSTVWGRTNKGWIGMGYVRMDGTAPAAGSDNGKQVNSDGNYNVLGYGVVDLQELNLRHGPGVEFDKVGTVSHAVRYAYYQIQDGWVRIDGGWVSTEYFYLEGSVTKDAFSATVTTDDLNIRTGPNTDFQSIGTYQKGEQVEVLGCVHRWAYTAQGWVSLDYLEEREPEYTTGVGTITIGLNIRQDANADSDIVGTYAKGDVITILEVQDGWGKTDKGWINLRYVEYAE